MVPDLAKLHQLLRLETAAHYFAGMHPKTKRQYHVQTTAIQGPDQNKTRKMMLASIENTLQPQQQTNLRSQPSMSYLSVQL